MATPMKQISRLPAYAMLVLIKHDGNIGKSMPLRKENYNLGSGADCEVQLKVDGVEPVHAKITRDFVTGETKLECLSLTKPIILNNAPVIFGNPVLLPYNSIFRIESKIFRFDPFTTTSSNSTPDKKRKSRASSTTTTSEATTSAAALREFKPTPPQKKQKTKEESTPKDPKPKPKKEVREPRKISTSPSITPAAMAAEGCILRFARNNSNETNDVQCVTELCRKYHIAHGPVNDLVTGRQRDFRNWKYLGMFDIETGAKSDLMPTFGPIQPREKPTEEEERRDEKKEQK